MAASANQWGPGDGDGAAQGGAPFRSSMVPIDGKNFFTSDVMRSAFQGGVGASSGGDYSEDPAPVATAAAQRKGNKRP